MATPLAERIRPRTLDEMVGQEHLLGPEGILRRIAQGGEIPNMIFYGPSGVGKTTAARIIAGAAGKTLYKLNGTTASTGDIKALIHDLDSFAGVGGVVLYLDEIQYLNKKQQQTLLEFIEDGSITLIASTTENPYFYIYNAILSRSTVFEFKSVSPAQVLRGLQRVLEILRQDGPVEVEDGVLEHLSYACGGDVRKSINALELAYLGAIPEDGVRRISMADAVALGQRSAMRYDKDGDQHYDLLSALQKSIRGSDENAALHYLARLLEAGDLLSPCRRLLVIASEDVGMAYPMAIVITKACVDSAIQLGLPEARIPLGEAVVLLATSPKSNSSYMAINEAMADVRAGRTGDIPRQLQNKHYDGADAKVKGQFYRYPHDFPGHWVEQQYLPDPIKDRIYYHFGDNKTEQAALEYRRRQRGTSGK